MNSHRVLIVDDDESIRSYLACFLSSRGYAVDCLPSADGVAARLESPNRPSLMILDILMPAVGGLEVLAEMEKLNRSIPTIVLSAVDQVPTVVKAMRLGASDYLIKPFEDEDLELAIDNVLRDVAPDGVKTTLSAALGGSTGCDFPSSHPKIQRIKEIAQRVADADVPVLILGESGVGKEVLARFIHAQSRRRSRPFLKVNCAALPADLLESELFGYERGAFTGAMREKQGKFELADKGTILLDEIGEMTSQLQAKLLHVLQDGEYTRLGGTRPVHADARVLASTNRRLEEAVAQGDFREDLFYRLNVIKLEIPPLRERREDIPMLCSHLMEKHRVKYGRPALELPQQLLDVFCRYSWPGNVRQLENAIKRFVILPDTDLVLSDLKAPAPPQEEAAALAEPVSLKKVSALAAEHAEKEVILRALEARNWNRKQVARELNICYKSLLNKLHRWQIPGRSRSGTLPPTQSGAAAG